MAKQPQPKEVKVTVSEDAPNFKWQMVFNAFSLEQFPNGVLARFAYVVGNTAAEIVPVFICNEGLEHLRLSAQEYIRDFDAPIRDDVPLPRAREFSPMFANHVRLARSGSSAEVSFLTVPLTHIANLAKGQPVGIVHPVQVALLHSDVQTHQQLVLGLLTSATK